LPIKYKPFGKGQAFSGTTTLFTETGKWPNYDRKCSGETDIVKEKQQERKREKEREEMLG